MEKKRLKKDKKILRKEELVVIKGGISRAVYTTVAGCPKERYIAESDNAG